nr:MAG: RNA-dependent RNA polymerase [Sanya bunya-like virus 1]
MHNCRYLIVNPLAKHANIQGIIESFAGFNYTYMELWLRTQLLKNYSEFASGLMKARNHPRAKIDHLLSNSHLRDLWFEEPLVNADQLTTFIYTTYMMTKAPVNSSLEQASNLWEILEDVDYYSRTHPDVDGMKDLSQRFSILEDDDSVYESDFKYDPVFSNYLGHHLASYVQKNITVAELTNKWERIKNQDIDHIANSNGLRGWKNSNFYNKKGYEIVYEKVDELMRDQSLLDLVEGYLQGSDSTAASLIEGDRNRVNLDLKGKNLIFHIVHKIQRGGNREIFCMDLDTKSLQNPIEQFLKHICKSIPNEYISIPSNKRHGLIHSDFYERNVTKGVNLTMRWVLDCRRWAPHSVFQKYVYFIEGLAVVLPPDFVVFFRNFAEGMFKKKFLTRSHVYSKLQNNIRFAQYKHLLHAAEVIGDTYEMTVKFSFVMGIFNYLSTLMHAANQMVASEVIRNQCLLNGEGLVILDPKCHSDDSVVSSYHTDPKSRRRSILLYDWLLKGANHMLSIKKSQINDDVYLEFLSVLYLFDRFLPVLPKFASSLPFKPSDKGYSADISFAITQSVEVLTQGGTYEESFLMMKLTESFVQKIYRLNYVKGLPFNFLGTIDSHPIEFLYAGGYADVYRSMIYSPDQFWRCYRFLLNSKLVDPEASDIGLKWDMSSRITGGPKKILQKYKPVLEKLPEDVRWTLSNSKLGNSFLNLLWYVNKLSDRMFYSSLVDEPSPRRFARIFGSGAYRQIRGSNGSLYDVPRLGIALSAAAGSDEMNSEPVSNVSAFLDFCCRDLKGFYDSLEGATIGETTISDTKEKPIVFSQSVGVLGKIDISAVEYVSYLREPNGFRLLGKRSNPYRECERLSTHLRLLGADIDGCSNDQLYALARKLTRDDAKSYRLVMPVPGDSRRVDSYSSALLTLSYNSTKWWKIEIRGHRAAVVDWNRKVMHTVLPSTVTDFLEVCWFKDTVIKYAITDLDVFKVNLTDLLDDARKNVPAEWKPIVDAEQNPSKVLAEMPYWCCWTQEQVRLGTRWFGSGVCYISIPEAILKLTVSSGEVKEMLIETTHQGSFSKASSWYLSVFITYSGLRFESIPAEMADPSCVYLGFNTEDHIYGVGRPKTFDWVYSMTILGYSVLPSFSKKELPFKKVGNNLLYLDYDQEYKVKFFIPLDRPVIVNVNKYMDKEKVQALVHKSSELNNFLHEVSSSLLGSSKKDKKYLLEHISSSLLHNILFNSSYYQSVMTSFQGTMPLMSALNEWKQTHPGFGFPSRSDLESLARQGETNPLTPKIWDMLQMLGHSGLNRLEFESLIYKVLVLAPDERLSYLLSMYPNLSDQHKVGSLVLVSRSDRIYKSCFMLGKDTHRLYIDLMECIAQAMEAGNVKSNILHSYAISLSENRLRTVSQPELLMALSSQVLLDCYDIQLQTSDGIPSVKLCYDVVMELWDEGLSQWLNIASAKSATFRTVEFKVEKEMFSDWLVDILDCLAGFAEFQPNRNQSFQSLAGEQRGSVREGKFCSSWAPLKKYLSRSEIAWAAGEVTLYKQGRKRVGPDRRQVPNTKRILLKKLSEGDPGVVDTLFKPQEEDSLDEYRYSWEYDDESEEIVFDSDAEIEDWAYFSITHLNKRALKRIRGTAWNIVYACRSFSKELMSLQDKWSVYIQNTRRPLNLYNLFSGDKYLVLIGRDTEKIGIPGYRKLQWQDVMKHVQSNIYRNDKKTEIMGKMRSRKEILEQPVLLNELQTLDSYFKSIKVKDLEKEVEQKETEIKVVSENLFLTPDSEALVSELNNLVSQYETRKKKISKVQEEEETRAVIDLDSDHDLITILNKQISLLDTIEESAATDGDERAMLKMVGIPSQHRFKEAAEVLTDPDFKSEFETWFPGYWAKIMRKEISMSRARKKQRLENAKMRISHMKGEVKKRYTMLYGIMAFVLLELPENGGVKHLSDAFALDVDDLFVLEEEELGQDYELAPIYALLPEEYRSLPEDVDRIF